MNAQFTSSQAFPMMLTLHLGSLKKVIANFHNYTKKGFNAPSFFTQ